MKRVLLAATLLTAAGPLGARAEAINGLYIGAGAGANFLQSERYTAGATNGFVPTVRRPVLSYDPGATGLASVGYGFGNGLRMEVEGSYRYNSLNNNGRASSGGVSVLRQTGKEEKYGAMGNVLYDFDPNVLGLAFIPFPVTPYVGVGVGYQFEALREHTAQVDQFGPIASNLGGTRGSFAYQAIVGAAFPIAAVPGLAVTAEYRFLGLSDPLNFGGPIIAPATAATPLQIGRATAHFSGNDYNHSLLVGLRYAFNTVPPPVEAPPPVVQPQNRTYLVFFDWDRADLTNRARQIIAEAAQATTRVQTTRIEVSGYTDSSGTARYNQGLSIRRAQNVSAELVRLGVPRQAITVQGFGETRQLVPTANGVREPQNRRVEIVLR